MQKPFLSDRCRHLIAALREELDKMKSPDDTDIFPVGDLPPGDCEQLHLLIVSTQAIYARECPIA